MPSYLLWGFRWPRPLIKIHIILNDIEDAAPEWLVSGGSTAAMLQNFHSLFPAQCSALPHLRFVEQYEATDLETTGQPFAFVAAWALKIELSASVSEVISKGVSEAEKHALVELRKALNCGKEECGWFVVHCSDEIRAWDDAEDEDADASVFGSTAMENDGANDQMNLNGYQVRDAEGVRQLGRPRSRQVSIDQVLASSTSSTLTLMPNRPSLGPEPVEPPAHILPPASMTSDRSVAVELIAPVKEAESIKMPSSPAIELPHSAGPDLKPQHIRGPFVELCRIPDNCNSRNADEIGSQVAVVTEQKESKYAGFAQRFKTFLVRARSEYPRRLV